MNPPTNLSTGLLGYLRNYRGRLVAGGILVVAAVAVALAIPFILRYVLDDLLEGTISGQKLLWYVLAYAVAHLASGGLALCMRRVMFGVGYGVETDLRRDMFARLTLQDPAFYAGERTGDLMTRMTSDLQSIRELVSLGLLHGWRTIVGITLAFVVMFAINVPITLMMLVWVPTVSIAFFLMLRVLRRRYDASQEQYSTLSSFVQESLGGIRTIKGFAIEPLRLKAFDGLNRDYMNLNLALSRIERLAFPLMGLCFAFGVAGVLLFGGRQVIQDRMSAGELVQFSQYLFFLRWPMLALGWTATLFQRGAASWARASKLLEAVPAIRDGDQTDSQLSSVAGAITFEGVSLHREGRALLEHIDLVVPEGATVGITGPTGSGKTLLASMIPRLIEPTLGTVRIGGRDVREYSLSALRAHVGMAPQEPFLFSDTLGHNIGFGLGMDEEERVVWAADVAQLRPDLEVLPSGLDTVLGERGVTLSGGQRQRTAISRAIAREVPILILDDIFSAIDTQTEALILEQLSKVVLERSCLLISHRVSTLRHADFIVVLEGGRITQQGSHDVLVNQAGYYQELDEMQRLEARLEESE